MSCHPLSMRSQRIRPAMEAAIFLYFILSPAPKLQVTAANTWIEQDIEKTREAENQI